ncbi:hypothetical protein SLS60_011748 [Paraconiothyrium brasiliense]|uniref:Enoyl reductase (ER) domain-containing protein n=1 Tax=Paraconiothyrium brasiliense TaxID=300254 RepID=A0ABR3QIK8_9PLEO
MANTMSLWQYDGTVNKIEEAVHLTKGPMPAIASLTKGQLLIRVFSVSLNPVDYKLPESAMGSRSVRRPAIPGLDFCGLVIAAHKSVNAFKDGQLVFGGFSRTPQHGTLAEYTVVAASECALLPDGVKPDQAAAAATAATTALQSLRSDVVKPGATVFINGGSGGVGTWGIQFAKIMGARVVTSCSGSALDLCKQLGADEVIDYTKSNLVADLKSRGAAFDLIVDNVGSTSDLYNLGSTVLKPGGMFVQVGLGGGMDLMSIAMVIKRSMLGCASTLTGGPRYYFVRASNSTESLSQIARWMVEGRAKAVIQGSFPFSKVPQAFQQLKQGHARGKIVISVADL